MFAAFCPSSRASDDPQTSRLEPCQEKRIVQPLYVVGVGEQQFVADEGGDQENGARFHRLDDVIIHGLVTNAMGKSVDTRRKQCFGVTQVKFVGEDADVLFM